MNGGISSHTAATASLGVAPGCLPSHPVSSPATAAPINPHLPNPSRFRRDLSPGPVTSVAHQWDRSGRSEQLYYTPSVPK